jgi:lysozyme
MTAFDVRAYIARHEGCRLRPYMDTVGKITIGYGRNLTDRGISQQTADDWLREDIEDCIHALTVYPWFLDLSEARQAVCVDIMFNVGQAGFTKFHKMIAAIERGDFMAATDEILNSRIAPMRARDNALLMRNG